MMTYYKSDSHLLFLELYHRVLDLYIRPCLDGYLYLDLLDRLCLYRFYYRGYDLDWCLL
jgi:hypothetical protein